MSTTLTDAAGQVLLVTTERRGDTFDAVTCSPHADGFTVLNSLVGRSLSKAQLEMACDQAVDRNEVCILPASASPKWRIFLTPTLRTLEPSSRAEASRLMLDLFRASQAPEARSKALLVTHFANVRKYPEPHLAGILDSLLDLSTGSFLELRLLCLQLRPEHVAKFEENVREAIAARAKGDP